MWKMTRTKAPADRFLARKRYAEMSAQRIFSDDPQKNARESFPPATIIPCAGARSGCDGEDKANAAAAEIVASVPGRN